MRANSGLGPGLPAEGFGDIVVRLDPVQRIAEYRLARVVSIEPRPGISLGESPSSTCGKRYDPESLARGMSAAPAIPNGTGPDAADPIGSPESDRVARLAGVAAQLAEATRRATATRARHQNPPPATFPNPPLPNAYPKDGAATCAPQSCAPQEKLPTC